MEKTIVKETVRGVLRESLEPKDAFVELVAESKDAFSGMNANVVLENAAVNPRLVKDIDKTKTMYLENGDHRIMVFTNNKVHEVLDLATDERIVLGSRGEVMQYVNEKKAEGFKPVRNKGAIAKFLRKSVRKIANYVRKYGLITLVGVGVVAALIYFVGPMAVPFISQIAMKLGLGGLIGGGEAVEATGDWISPVPNVGLDAPQQFDDISTQIANTNDEIEKIAQAMSGDIDPATRNVLSAELQSATGYREYLQDVSSNRSSLAATAAAQVTAQVSNLNNEIEKISQAMSGDIAPETRNVLAAELQRLTQQRNSLR